MARGKNVPEAGLPATQVEGLQASKSERDEHSTEKTLLTLAGISTFTEGLRITLGAPIPNDSDVSVTIGDYSVKLTSEDEEGLAWTSPDSLAAARQAIPAQGSSDLGGAGKAGSIPRPGRPPPRQRDPRSNAPDRGRGAAFVGASLACCSYRSGARRRTRRLDRFPSTAPEARVEFVHREFDSVAL